MKTRISIVEDDEHTRRILGNIVNESPGLELASQHPNVSAALKDLPGIAPEVVLMDINMPGLSGIEGVSQLKPLMPDTQFLMLTVYEDTDHIFAALAAGATGYLLKNTSHDELIQAIKQILEGGSPMSSGIARKVVQSFNKQPPKAAAPELELLSPREHSVLSLLSQGLSYKEIAESLAISLTTVNSYIRRIYEKLQVNSRSQAIKTYQSGSRKS